MNKTVEIDVRYRILLQGQYNASVFICPECGHNLLSRGSVEFDYTKGFAELHGEYVTVTECPKCFDIFYCHTRDGYDDFLVAVETGYSIFFHPAPVSDAGAGSE